MTTPAKRHSGFTLIELLIVMVIMMTALSLVAPMGFEFLDKAYLQNDRVRLKNKLIGLRQQAFINGREIRADLSGHSLSVVLPSGKLQRIDFDYIEFAANQQVVISRNGFLRPLQIEFLAQGKSHQLSLADVNN